MGSGQRRGERKQWRTKRARFFAKITVTPIAFRNFVEGKGRAQRAGDKGYIDVRGRSISSTLTKLVVKNATLASY